LTAPLDREGRDSDERTAIPVRAPITGVVIQRSLESAGPVRAGQALLEIGDPSKLEVIAELLTGDALKLSPGADARLTASDGAEPVPGKLRRVEPGAFTKVSALGVEEQRVLSITDILGAARSWGDGYRIDVQFIVWRGAGVVTVPVSALFREGSSWRVYVVDAGRAALRPVEIGWMGEARAEVVSGLAVGDRVILHPSDELREGVRVREIVDQDAAS
jgi:HlyD family secretion protein